MDMDIIEDYFPLKSSSDSANTNDIESSTSFSNTQDDFVAKSISSSESIKELNWYSYETPNQSQIDKEINLDEISINKFKIGKPLGYGKFGNIYIATEKSSNYTVAIKSVSLFQIKKAHMETQLKREITIHKTLDHPNIIK